MFFFFLGGGGGYFIQLHRYILLYIQMEKCDMNGT